MMSLVLASQSPRRRELLATLGVEFDAISVDIDETPQPNEDPQAYVRRLGIQKAQAGLKSLSRPDAFVLGSDTAVVIDGRILGKPASKPDFLSTMNRLSGQTHQVMSSVALVNQAQVWSEVVITDVRFAQTDQALHEAYWATGEPHDKAGGYGIQGMGSVLVERISGSYSNVVGLPLRETAKILGKAGLLIWQGSLLLK